MAGARWGATRPRPRGSGRSVSEASQESPLRYSCASQFSIVIWLVRSRLPQPSRARSAKRPISPNRLLLKRERKGSGCVMRRNLPCLAGPGSRNGNTGRRVSQRATVPSSKTGREVTELGSGSPVSTLFEVSPTGAPRSRKQIGPDSDAFRVWHCSALRPEVVTKAETLERLESGPQKGSPWKPARGVGVKPPGVP